jgi:hypothetical protein
MIRSTFENNLVYSLRIERERTIWPYMVLQCFIRMRNRHISIRLIASKVSRNKEKLRIGFSGRVLQDAISTYLQVNHIIHNNWWRYISSVTIKSVRKVFTLKVASVPASGATNDGIISASKIFSKCVNMCLRCSIGRVAKHISYQYFKQSKCYSRLTSQALARTESL